jgi:hypothetical protein
MLLAVADEVEDPEHGAAAERAVRDEAAALLVRQRLELLAEHDARREGADECVCCAGGGEPEPAAESSRGVDGGQRERVQVVGCRAPDA